VAWLTVVHACSTPQHAAIREAEAQTGSRWKCDKCGDVWTLRQLVTNAVLLPAPVWSRDAKREEVTE
jgi:hypothetical protein